MRAELLRISDRVGTPERVKREYQENQFGLEEWPEGE
jgi:hypothetical protein